MLPPSLNFLDSRSKNSSNREKNASTAHESDSWFPDYDLWQEDAYLWFAISGGLRRSYTHDRSREPKASPEVLSVLTRGFPHLERLCGRLLINCLVSGREQLHFMEDVVLLMLLDKRCFDLIHTKVLRFFNISVSTSPITSVTVPTSVTPINLITASDIFTPEEQGFSPTDTSSSVTSALVIASPPAVLCSNEARTQTTSDVLSSISSISVCREAEQNEPAQEGQDRLRG
ncbi:hypothetical protein K435DRAFT_869987 [Dendrothele bispora CBS 962.96]|uniref:Uncharacterized protein n=1 Tax=Dendrothele bispora (strain CBS 962.96) TaxID=1314807 RepID=A0A4S8L7P8_DENBC|nr:hypothetical protein K435DRAFT_869987 [Dendrothele bispora CBS 962.96]